MTGSNVLWRRSLARQFSRGGTAKATAALGKLAHAALMLWLITQLHDCGNPFLSLEPSIKTSFRQPD